MTFLTPTVVHMWYEEFTNPLGNDETSFSSPNKIYTLYKNHSAHTNFFLKYMMTEYVFMNLVSLHKHFRPH